MVFTCETEIRDVYEIDEAEKLLIHEFLRGAVYCWIKNLPDKSFALRDLVGGENTDWDRTPLAHVYGKHRRKGKNVDEAFKDAAKDAGWLLKAVLSEDKRIFTVEKSGMVNAYRWIGEES